MSLPITVGEELAFPSLYIGAADLKGKDVTVTISEVKMDDLMTQKAKTVRKPILCFSGTPKMFVLNKTNAKIIAKLYGNNMLAWVGNRITLYPTKDKFGRDIVDCIRVRPNAPAPKQPQSEPGEELVHA